MFKRNIRGSNSKENLHLSQPYKKNMKLLNRIQMKYCKLLTASLFSFLLGCMVVINFVPINKTCQVDDTDREYSIMKNSKLKNPEIIILIISAPKNLDRRNTIRETWLKLKDRKQQNVEEENISKFSRHYFVIGSIGLTTDDILHLSAEQSQYNDMLILPIHDSYGNLTHKVISSFVWLKDQLEVGLDFKYILKCDDDSFVRLDNLEHEMKQIEIIYIKSDINDANIINTDKTSPYLRAYIQSKEGKLKSSDLQIYWGYFDGRAHIKTSGKWRESNWILCDNYLPYALGGGYILSKGLVTFLARNAEYLRYYNSEDVSMGAWLSSVNNILHIHDRRFDTEWTSRGCQNHHLISHNLNQKEFKKIYNNIITTGNMCDVETIKRSHYLYDWDLPPSKCCNNKQT